MDYILHNIIMNLSFALAVVLVFLAHELGHYLVAAACGVRAESVTIGVGREIWARTGRHGTRWSMRLLPVCGFVHFGRSDFPQRSLSTRFLIVLAGPAGNLILAYVALALFFNVTGVPSTPPLVTGVEIGSPAAAAGFQPGDEIISFRGQTLQRYEDMQRAIEAGAGTALPVTVKRDGRLINMQVTPVWIAYKDVDGFAQAHGRTGLLIEHIPMLLNAVTAVNGAATDANMQHTRDLLLAAMDGNTVIGLKAVDGRAHVYTIHPSAQLNHGLTVASVDHGRVYLDRLKGNSYLKLGVAGNFREATYATLRLARGLALVTGRLGAWNKSLITPETPMTRQPSPEAFAFYNFCYFMAAFSLCIALINLLPLPGLDGSFLFMLLVEAVAGPARAAVWRARILRQATIFLLVLWLAENSGLWLKIFNR